VRITGQVIDATNGAHIWADRFEGALDDVFDLQDRVAASVAGIIEPKLRHVEMERARRKPTESLDAYDLLLRALALWNVSRESNAEALRLLHRAIEIDPHYAAPYGLAAACYVYQRGAGWVSPSDPVLAEGIRLARLAATLGQDDPETLSWAALVLNNLAGDQQGAITLVERALELNPNLAVAWRISGAIRTDLDPELAIAHAERSGRLSPLDVQDWFRSLTIAWAHFHARRYDEASSWADRMFHTAPKNYLVPLLVKAATCALLGRQHEGRSWVERILAISPQTTAAGMRVYYGIFKAPDTLERFLDGLRRAGLPE